MSLLKRTKSVSSSSGLIERALECPPLVLGDSERHTELKQLEHSVRELAEEDIVVLGIPLGVLAEHLVLDDLHIGRQHHERLGLDILILLRTIPLLPGPLLLEQKLIVVVCQGGRGEGPGTVVARAVGVATAEGVGTGQSNHLSVVEAHAAEDGADVLAVLGGVGEAAVRCAEGDVAVGAAGAVGDLGALHLLDGTDAAEDPEVGVGDPGELLCRNGQLLSLLVTEE